VGDSEEDARAFAEEFGWDFPVLLDADLRLSQRLFGGPVHPAVVLLDAEGGVVARHIGVSGPIVWDALAASATGT
jgi:hypothetical protein